MKKITFVLLALTAALAGCEQKTKIENGMVPNELLPYVQTFVGDYRGQFEHRATNLTVALDGNRLVATASDDLIAPACQSKIGNLKAVYTKEKDHVVKVTGAVFSFDPNLCSNDVVGRELSIDFMKGEPVTFNMEYLDHYESERKCDYTSIPPPNVTPINRCWYETIGIYNGGRFVKN